MSTELFEKIAKRSEGFIMNVMADRVRQISGFFSSDVFDVRPATTIEDTDFKCDFFLMKNGVEHMAFDVKTPIGTSGKSMVELDAFWVCPYVESKNDTNEVVEKDVSIFVKSKYPSIVNRYIAFAGTDAVYCVNSERIAAWAIGNRTPDFRGWVNKEEHAAFAKFTGRNSSTNFFIFNKKPGRILTKIKVKELEPISHKIPFVEEEKAEWNKFLNELIKESEK